MFNGRRVGTLTAGLVLILFGVLFLLRVVSPNINYLFIVSFWPVILIILGIEVVVGYVVNKEEKIKYDTGAIWLIILLSFFAMGMGGVEFIMTNLNQFNIMI